MKKTISLRFEWFWPDFNKSDNFIVNLLESTGLDVRIVDSKHEKVDVEIVSVFPPFRRKLNEKVQRWKKSEKMNFGEKEENFSLEKYPDTANFSRRIWFTGENMRPPLSHRFDGFLSFDSDSFNSLNAYLPIWYFEVDFFQKPVKNRTGLNIRIDDLLRSRDVTELRKNFAVSFIGNPHPIRMQTLETFKQFTEIDTYGSSVNRPIATKYEASKNSIFALCFENDLYPGYVTEKLIEAYACGNIPLYWGLFEKDSVINRNSNLNLADFDSIQTFAEHVISLKKSDLLEIANEPLLTRKPDFQEIVKVITDGK